jgi:hypothetical protein
MIPKKYAPLLFSLILSGQMSLLISGITTFRAAGWGPGFFGLWLGGWLMAWVVAFPAVLLVSPPARVLVRLMTAER